MEIGISIEEVLGDGDIGAGLHLAREVLEIAMVIVGLRMALGIGRHRDLEVIAGLLAHELDQLVGVTQLAARAHPGGQVPAQRHQALDTLLTILRQDLTQLTAVAADTRQVRRGADAAGADRLHGVEGALTRGATRAIGDGEELRLQRRQLIANPLELFTPGLGIRREEFEADP